MKFDFVIGNPPYQETKKTKNVDVWQNFISNANKVANCSVMIHPGRWVIPKKQMEGIHDEIIRNGLFRFDWYPNASKVFGNGVSIDGGVTITMLDLSREEQIKYYNNGEYFGIYSDAEKFFENEFEKEAYNKIFSDRLIGQETIAKRIVGNVGSLGGEEFGYKKSKHIHLLKETSKGMTEPIKIWANNQYGKGTRYGWHFIEKNELDRIPNGLFESRKVMLDKKGHAVTSGRGNVINNIPQIVDKDATASGDVLFVFPENDTDSELELIKRLFMTKTIRFLMTITQKDLYVRGFENVPDYLYFQRILKGKMPTDEFLYQYFGFSPQLVEHIEKYVSPKED